MLRVSRAGGCVRKVVEFECGAGKDKATASSLGRRNRERRVAARPGPRRDAVTLPEKRTGLPLVTQALGEGAAPDELLRRLMQQLVQEAIEQEFERFLGAGRWQRTPERAGWRNGRQRRRLKTRVGEIELRIPRDRKGLFQPSLFERYQRSEQALVLALVEMYLQGVSTRKVTRIVERLCGVAISASPVSGLVKKLDGELEAWRQRSLAEVEHPYLIVDAHYEKVRVEGRVRTRAVLWVVGVREDGYREHLGCGWARPRVARAGSGSFATWCGAGSAASSTWSPMSTRGYGPRSRATSRRRRTSAARCTT